MLKAFAIKALAIAAAIAAIWTLPAGWAALVVTLIAIATVGFFVYTIVHPSSQFFVPVVDRLATRDSIIALTFDDGPDPVFTPKILDLLAAHGAHGSFFVLGDRAAQYPELIRRMHREGHTVGTHTQNHRVRFHFGSPGFVKKEIEDAVAVVAKLVPESPVLFRPPQGLRTPLFAWGWGRTHGLTCVTWSVRGLDSFTTTAGEIVTRVTRKLEPGAIVTLHDGTGLGGGNDRAPTIEALGTLLTECKTRGLRCVSLSTAGVP
ncbi:polysaccharide deacetylase family protein [soil metagenome]